MERGISALGLVTMLALAWLMSSNRWKVSPRLILGGVGLQLLFAAIILRTNGGHALFGGVKVFFDTIMACVDTGTNFVFGFDTQGKPSFLESFALRALPVIIVFSSLMSVLYYFGIIQLVVKACALVMQRTLGTSGAESLAAAANILIGQTEAPLVVRPYLMEMTKSELMALMVGGFATVAGGMLAAYANMGISAGHLVTASFISAPAALVVAKILQPEVEESKTLGTVTLDAKSEAVNVIHAASMGAADGMKLAINVAAMILAFLALIAACEFIVGGIGSWFGQEWSLQAALGYGFAPLAWLMGIPKEDCLDAGRLLGIKTVANEFIAYKQLSDWMPEGEAHHFTERTEVILTYALCGFANFGSIGIQIGGIGPLIPERQALLAQLGFRAMIGGTLAAFMTACIAGMLL